jgi:IclR family acetate operon transcriptional repressor
MELKMAEKTGGIQSIERAFAVLEHLSSHGGQATLSELAEYAELPMPTTHRILRTLVDTGYIRHLPDRRYALGPSLIGIGHGATQLVPGWVVPHLEKLVEATGETANMAMLDGSYVLYVAQAPSRHSMRMFTEVGRRVSPHCTGVGKAMLALLSEAELDPILDAIVYERHTARTIRTRAAFLRVIETARQQGYAVDDSEHEVGVRCIAVPLKLGGVTSAISVSGPAARLTKPALDRAHRDLKEVARIIEREFSTHAA